MVRLDAACRNQQVNDGCFERLADVPTHAYTLTIPALLRAPVVSVVVPGPRKANAVLTTLQGPISEACPATRCAASGRQALPRPDRHGCSVKLGPKSLTSLRQQDAARRSLRSPEACHHSRRATSGQPAMPARRASPFRKTPQVIRLRPRPAADSLQIVPSLSSSDRSFTLEGSYPCAQTGLARDSSRLVSSCSWFARSAWALPAPQDQKKSPKDAAAARARHEIGQHARGCLRDASSSRTTRSEAVIDKMIAEYDLKPNPLPAIPDDPPPHEGAMISLPYVVEPPDLVIVEVLEALPGRPISGERLVRPDGKISLGFYGEVDARGLTLEQLKVAIIKHLRRFLAGRVSGSENACSEEIGAAQDPDAAGGRCRRSHRRRSSRAYLANEPRHRPHSQFGQARCDRSGRGDHLRRRVAQRQGRPEAAENNSRSTGSRAASRPKRRNLVRQTPFEVGARRARLRPIRTDRYVIVPPAESNRVFVDVTAYNTKNYYVEGDVQITGQVALDWKRDGAGRPEYAGGLLPTAEPKDIRLVRPGGMASRQESTKSIWRRSRRRAKSRRTIRSFRAIVWSSAGTRS